MRNLISKSLVQAHLVVSVLALAWALSLYFDPVDWGWKTPRKEVDYVIASELDKRRAEEKETYRRRDFHYPAVKDGWPAIREAEEFFVQNNLWYRKELDRLAAHPEKIEVYPLKYVDGILELETKDSSLGKPAYKDNKEKKEEPLPDLEKSLKSYQADLQEIYKTAEKLEREFRDWQLKQKENSEAKIGKFDNGKQTKKGLLDLRAIEIEMQARILDEIRYLQPREVVFRRDAEIYRERRKTLEEDLERALKNAPKKN